MKSLRELTNEHCENMRPGSSVPHTQQFEDAWEIRVSFEDGFIAGESGERIRAKNAVMDLFYALREIGGTPTLRDLVKLARRIKE